MKYLILSDIHGNREALEAVLADACGSYDQILCLGDLVGYGPDPNFVVDWAQENVATVVRGNHDRSAAGLDSADSWASDARDSSSWTREALTPENRDYLASLPSGPVRVNGFELVHGSPVDEDQYVTCAAQAGSLLPHLTTPLLFFGHTHRQGAFRVTADGAEELDAGAPVRIKPDDGFFMVNPGSVGQPRDGNWRAAYAVYSPDEGTVRLVRVAYGAGPTAEKIVLAGLPVTLAARLLMGK